MRMKNPKSTKQILGYVVIKRGRNMFVYKKKFYFGKLRVIDAWFFWHFPTWNKMKINKMDDITS